MSLGQAQQILEAARRWKERGDGALFVVPLLTAARSLASETWRQWLGGDTAAHYDVTRTEFAKAMVALLGEILAGPAIAVLDAGLLRTIAGLTLYGCRLDDPGPNDLQDFYPAAFALDLSAIQGPASAELRRREPEG